MSLAQLLILRDAVASVSLSHKADCECRTCKAAKGDEKAFAEILVEAMA